MVVTMQNYRKENNLKAVLQKAKKTTAASANRTQTMIQSEAADLEQLWHNFEKH